MKNREVKFRIFSRTFTEDKMFYDVGCEWENDGLWWFCNNKTRLFQLGSTRFNLMQYTGIKDKNGKEIYEGDILQIPALHSDQPESNPYDIVQIIIRNGCTMWKDISTGKEELIYLWLGDSDTDEDSTIIGNIYENPELINSK